MKKGPLRRCIGCGRVEEKTNFLRFCFQGEEFIYDPLFKKGEKGYYVCPEKECFKKMIKRLSKRKNINKEKMIKMVFYTMVAVNVAKNKKPLKINRVPTTVDTLWNIVKNMI